MNSGRFNNIDSLRGLASIFVLYYHFSEYFYKGNELKYILERGVFYLTSDVFDLGKLAVVLFFAISGFVVPYSLLRPRSGPIRHFVVSRFFRLYPAYWASLLLTIASLWAFGTLPETREALANMTMVQQFIGFDNVNGVYWTLHIELVFYVLVVGLFLIGFIRESGAVLVCACLILCVAIAAAALRFALEKDIPVAIPLSLVMMLWGLLMRRDVYGESGRRHLHILTTVLLVAVPAIAILAYNKDYGFRETWHRYTLTYYMAMLIFWLILRVKDFGGPVLLFYGKISYSFYLLGFVAQLTVISLVGEQVIRELPIHLSIVVAVALNTVMASVVYFLIEQPAVGWARALSRFIQPNA